MMERESYLFAQGHLPNVVEAQSNKMCSEIDAYEPDYVLNVNLHEMCDFLEQKYRIEPLCLKVESITTDHGEANVKSDLDLWGIVDPLGGPRYVKGTFVTFIVPFEGDPSLFKLRPATHNVSPPRGSVVGNELHLTIASANPNPQAMRAEFDAELQKIQRHIEWSNSDLASFNVGLKQAARQHIESRRQKILNDQGIATALGFPVRRRAGAAQTYAVPVVRRELQFQRPHATSKPREPALDTSEYEHILSIISNMVEVMERSPAAFSTLDEEALRTHFLVQLNGQYEGQATGETFNCDGKTDILIRVEGRNIFIAECLVWRGAEYLTEKIDQLLGYTSWRDTKTAIIIFNRNKNTSAVVAQVPKVVTAHPNCVQQLEWQSESGFRFAMRHRDDENREFTLSLLVFDVPT